MNNITNPAFYLGVVEDRMDPLKIGRVRVRVLGLHTHDRVVLPTTDLPWAYKIQPTTSGAISGIGTAPVGVMEGTWVLVQYIDPEKQMPFVVGSIGGVPQNKQPPLESFELTNTETAVVDGSGNPVTTGSGGTVVTQTPSPTPAPTPAPASDPQWKAKVTRRLGELESGGKYTAVNTLGYLGKYQFGAAALTDRGYVKSGTTNKQLDDPAVWTAKNGINNKQEFLNNQQIQEQVMSEQVDANYKALKRRNVPMDTLTDAQKAGFIAAAHLYGPGGAAKLYDGVVKADAYGTTTEKYYKEGYKAVAGEFPSTVAVSNGAAQTPTQVSDQNTTALKDTTPAEDDASPTQSTSDFRRNTVDFLNPSVGFKDPNMVYPLKTHVNEPDTNRLARHENIQKTVVFQKEQKRHKGVEKANGKGTWDQSPIPYNAEYPFNNVLQTESGHILEFDDTKGKERIHMYHAKGTFTEVDHNGTQVNLIVGDNYTIMERNGYVYVVGGLHVTVDGAKTLKIEGTLDVQVNGAAVINVHDKATINAAGDLNVSTASILNVHATRGLNLNSGGSINIKASGNIAIDGSKIDLNSGNSSARSLETISQIGASTSNPGSLQVSTRGEEKAINYEVEPEATDAEVAAAQEKLVNDGILTKEQVAAEPTKIESKNVDPNNTQEKDVSKAPDGKKDFDYNEKFSKHYTLGDLTSGGSRKLVPQAGLKESDLYNNLKLLANNVLDVVKDKYPNVKINSGLRLGNGPSQHDKGQAVDISFPDLSRTQLYDRVLEVQKLVPHDQMLLEYLTPGGNGWIHISFAQGQNRGMVFTMNNHKRVSEIGTFTRIA